jgi:hypothetical protein
MVFKSVSPWNTAENFTPDLFPDDVTLVTDNPLYYEDGKRLYYFTGECDVVAPLKYGILENAHRFEKIYTHDPDLLARLAGKAIKFKVGYGAASNYEDVEFEYQKVYKINEDTSKKEFKISGFCGSKLIQNSYGHHLRHHVYKRQAELPENVVIFRSSTQQPPLPIIRHNPFMKSNLREGIEEMHDTFQFSIQIENSLEQNYFTEKLITCLINKTIPVYWGCSNIDEYFDTTGWIFFHTFEELKDKLSRLTPDYYSKYTEVIEKNAKAVMKYANWPIYFESVVKGN